MNRICWWLAKVFSRLLSPEEQEAACGDLVEQGVSGGQALRDLSGLLLRRQAALWMHWKPWLTLVCLIAPLSLMLSLISRGTAYQSAVYLWMYAANWNSDLLKNTGFWYELVHVVWIVIVQFVTLACLAWTSGFVLGAASRRIVKVNGVLFCFLLLFGALLGAPLYLSFWSRYLQHAFAVRNVGGQDPVLFSIFYPACILMVQALLVALPALWAMRQGAGTQRRLLLPRSFFLTAAFFTLAIMVIQAPGFGLLLRLSRWQWIWQSWEMQWVRLIVYWPVLYLAASVVARLRRPRPAAV